MGTGVGEAALAAEAVAATEAAGAVAGGAGFLEGMAGVSALEGAGVAGLGLGTGAGLTTGAGLAGGLGSLAPAFQTALGETAVFNPEIAAQTAQFANVGAMPSANAALGAGQIGDPALAQLTQAFQNAPTSVQTAAMYGPGTQVAAAPGVGVDSVMGDVLRQGSSSLYDLGATDMSLGAAGQANAAAFDPTTLATAGQGAGDISAMVGNADKAAMLSDAGYGPMASPAELGSPKTGFGLSDLTRPLKATYDFYKEQDPLTQGVMKYGGMGLGALQAAKYLNKTPGAYSPPAYNGPLSKFTYSPDTYRPYTYKPYAAGGPVEEMSRENAMGANTGYPQADIRQGAYATPWQTPVSRNVVAGADDANVDMMTGAERMAEGGEASSGAASSDAGDTGIAALGPMMYSPGMMSSSLVDPAEAYAASQPTMDMTRQNFQDFLARYQNLPITEAPPAPVTYTGLYAGEGPKPVEVPYDPGWGGYSGAGGGRVSPDGFGGGGISNLGGYSDGGRLLKGPGDGMSDNIPANISGKQPARLADGEFVVPADVVSGLGNGSTDAGAKQLYKMLDKVRSARTGTKKQGKQIKPNKYLPA